MNGPHRPPEDGHRPEHPDSAKSPADERHIAELLADSGSRTEVPPEHLASIKTAFRTEWRQHIAERSSEAAAEPTSETAAPPLPFNATPATDASRTAARHIPPEQRSGRWLPLAAVLLIGLGLGGWWLLNGPHDSPLGNPEAPIILAQVERSDGSLRLEGEDRPLLIGANLAAGTTVRTGPNAGSALRLANGSSLRLDAGTRITLTAEGRLDLLAGAVYLQSEDGGGGGGRSGGAVAIHTAFGIAREIGTQFEVRLLEQALRLRVREGKVALEYGEEGEARVENVTPGQEITLGANGEPRRARMEPWAEEWRWTLDTAPALVIDGRTLRAVLDDIARETGRRLVFENDNVEAEAAETVFHGRVEALAPDRALVTILPGAGLSHRIEDGVMWIGTS